MKKLVLLVLFSFTLAFTTAAIPLDEIKEVIVEWIGVPYRYGGTTKRGVDCSGLTQQLYKQIYNIVLPRTAKQQWAHTKRIDKDSLQEGDLVFFKSRGPSGGHVGMYLGEGKFIHSPSRRDKVKISDLNSTYYSKMYKGAGRIPQMEEI
jgi:lipoprotein Spr